MVKKSTLLILGVIALLVIFGIPKQLTFTAFPLFPVQYVGDLSQDPTTESFRDRVSSSSEARVGDYLIKTVQDSSYTHFSEIECLPNTCLGTEESTDVNGCPIYVSDFTKEERECRTGQIAFSCFEYGCVYSTGTCEPETSDCDAVSNEAIACTSGFLQDGLCRSELLNVEYVKTIDCLMTGGRNVCGGGVASGFQEPRFGCANQYEIFYKNVLVDEVKGAVDVSGAVLSVQTLEYFRGEQVTDSRSADLVMRLRQTNKFRSFPRTCLLTTNEYDIPVTKEHIDVEVVKEGEGTQQVLKIAVINNMGLSVFGDVKVKYSMDTILGRITKVEQNLLSLPPQPSMIIIPIPEAITLANIDIEVQTNILLDGNDFQGINFPSFQCFVGSEGEFNPIDDSGALISSTSCTYIKIGESQESFIIRGEVVDEGTDSNVITDPIIDDGEPYYVPIGGDLITTGKNLLQKLIDILTNLLGKLGV